MHFDVCPCCQLVSPDYARSGRSSRIPRSCARRQFQLPADQCDFQWGAMDIGAQRSQVVAPAAEMTACHLISVAIPPTSASRQSHLSEVLDESVLKVRFATLKSGEAFLKRCMSLKRHPVTPLERGIVPFQNRKNFDLWMNKSG